MKSESKKVSENSPGVKVAFTRKPRFDMDCDVQVSGANARYDVKGDEDALLVVNDGNASQWTRNSQLVTRGRFVTANFNRFMNYDPREQGFVYNGDRLESVLTDGHLTSAVIERQSDGSVVAKMMTQGAFNQRMSIVAYARRSFLPSRLLFFSPTAQSR